MEKYPIVTGTYLRFVNRSLHSITLPEILTERPDPGFGYAGWKKIIRLLHFLTFAS